tara:strand:- start:281 stop:565 length:285 start_codon:yes stop_codon:yes gene_type:complete
MDPQEAIRPPDRGVRRNKKTTEGERVNQIYVAAKSFVDKVNDPNATEADIAEEERELNSLLWEWKKRTGYIGYPLGYPREAAMNGWPLPQKEKE